MVEIDPKSLETKSLKISASEVLHNKRYSNLKNRGGRFVPPVMSRVNACKVHITKFVMLGTLKSLLYVGTLRAIN